MNTLTINWQRLLDEHNNTCPRCGSTEQEVEKAVQDLKQALAPEGIDVSLVKQAIPPEIFRKDVLKSNRIMIAGRTLEEWLGAETGQSRCCDACGDAECRTVEYAAQTYETIPADLIVKAGLRAASEIFNVELSQLDQRKSRLKMLSKKC